MLEPQPPLYSLPLAFFTARAGDTRKVSRDSLDQLIAYQVSFLEVENVDWSLVRRGVFFAYQQFQYVYPDAVKDLSQRLMVMPKQHYFYGGQRLLDFKLTSEPIPLEEKQWYVGLGNTVIELEVAHISHWTSFEVMFCVERTSNQPMQVSRSTALNLKRATSLTKANAAIKEVALTLKTQSNSSLELAQRISDWVSNTMQYKSGVTNVQTSATEVLEIKAGLCQDYAHLMLALCRAAGLPARYVSGHMLGEGGSHAWVEVLIENDRKKYDAIGFDPTNARAPNLGYVVVALGRDYTDVPPTSGKFIGDAVGVLHFEKHAGMLELEFLSGEIWRSS